MCGINGIAVAANADLLGKMSQRVSHRGPDDSGQYVSPDQAVGFAMRQLGSADLAGHQPMPNEDRTVWVVLDGRVVNAPELRLALASGGHRFQSRHSDAEVLAHLYEDLGSAMVEHLSGMFAFVIHDQKAGRLFGARDRLGIKPLHYTTVGGHFAFASEIKSLLELPWVSRKMHPESVSHYLSLQHVPGPRSIFEDIWKLAPGHSFEFDISAKDFRTTRYWRLPLEKKERSVSEWQQAIREKMEESVTRLATSELPIACSLSGGVDSAGLAGLLSKAGRHNLRTYTWSYAGREHAALSEIPLARLVAKKWSTRHIEVDIEPESLTTDLKKMVSHLGEPHGGALSSWYLYKAIAEDCKVVLTGAGGSALFGNSGTWGVFEQSSIYRTLKACRESTANGSLRPMQDARRSPHGHFWPRFMSDSMKESVLRKDYQLGEPTEAMLERIWEEAGSSDARDSAAYIDIQTHLPEELLLMTDRFSMAHSVETRMPFLDHELVELVYQMPSSLRTKPGDLKYFMRELMSDLVPAEVLAAPRREAVFPPSAWTRDALKPLINERLSPGALAKQSVFTPSVWEHFIEPHLEKKADFTNQIWAMLMFEVWRDEYRAF